MQGCLRHHQQILPLVSFSARASNLRPPISQHATYYTTQSTLADSMAATLLDASLTAQEALSGVFGSISLAAWIFLLVCAMSMRAPRIVMRESILPPQANPPPFPRSPS